jgi:hypothetical protein
MQAIRRHFTCGWLGLSRRTKNGGVGLEEFSQINMLDKSNTGMLAAGKMSLPKTEEHPPSTPSNPLRRLSWKENQKPKSYHDLRGIYASQKKI